MAIIDPKNTSTHDFHQFMLGAVAPRPIAFVSTIDADGNPNLAPYSFFNAFSSNPPILVFSSNRRVANNTTKDTLANVFATREAVVNVVTYSIVRQMAVTSVEFESGVSEFEKSGLTPIPSDLVKPPRVKESPVNMECVVKDIITLGEHGGAGHLIICEVLRMHIDDSIIDEKNRIDPDKIDLMGRMGRAYYVRASGPAVHTIVQSVTELAIGWQALPESVRNSRVLTGNELGMLAGLKEVPSGESISQLVETDVRVKSCLGESNPQEALHRYASELLQSNRNRELAGRVVWFASLREG
ncbi:MAG: flavin reductase family protein [Saprospiraceae bacterium]|nr:flavin reductase family protein [Saprospiraceae bacterium]